MIGQLSAVQKRDLRSPVMELRVLEVFPHG